MSETAHKPDRSFAVQVEGFDPHIVHAPTRSAARYRNYRAYHEAGFPGDFGWFMTHRRITVAPATTSGEAP